ncbi:MAG: TRL-like family protein [bacterium]|nr:TRL-like family protein [bacterium]
MRNSLLAIAGAAALLVACAGTLPVGDPRFGRGASPFLPSSYTYPAPGYGAVVEVGSKTGTSCITEMSYPLPYPLSAATLSMHGDGSVETAARLGGITEITSVAYRYKNSGLGLFGTQTQICTIVTGE